ncbi:hypothetical protein GCM10022225_67630 [Plantactinospora mayteni]|uniref:Uncharacterized protein n=1 Tax=Plantactinospora mayteni TaxID=566021 RepID=A0ABQ4EV70_9ACTN|nr:hypothetical protein [Plantactinospora mayteni]GIG98563.1 hypothetical protein Pma05_51360 [Plantactinospora mayteni]
MADPVMVTAVAALVSWATTELAEGGRSAAQSLISYVRERFRNRPDERAVVDAALCQPSTPVTASRLADLLEQESAADPVFGEEFRSHWTRVHAALIAAQGGVLNSVWGDVSGTVVQARDVRGGINPRPCFITAQADGL